MTEPKKRIQEFLTKKDHEETLRDPDAYTQRFLEALDFAFQESQFEEKVLKVLNKIYPGIIEDIIHDERAEDKALEWISKAVKKSGIKDEDFDKYPDHLFDLDPAYQIAKEIGESEKKEKELPSKIPSIGTLHIAVEYAKKMLDMAAEYKSPSATAQEIAEAQQHLQQFVELSVAQENYEKLHLQRLKLSYPGLITTEAEYEKHKNSIAPAPSKPSVAKPAAKFYPAFTEEEPTAEALEALDPFFMDLEKEMQAPDTRTNAADIKPIKSSGRAKGGSGKTKKKND